MGAITFIENFYFLTIAFFIYRNIKPVAGYICFIWRRGAFSAGIKNKHKCAKFRKKKLNTKDKAGYDNASESLSD